MINSIIIFPNFKNESNKNFIAKLRDFMKLF